MKCKKKRRAEALQRCDKNLTIALLKDNCELLAPDSLASFYVHYPMSRKRHLYKSSDILFAPVINKPYCTLIFTHDAEFFKFFPPVIRDFFLRILKSNSFENILGALLHIRYIRIEFIEI